MSELGDAVFHNDLKKIKALLPPKWLRLFRKPRAEEVDLPDLQGPLSIAVTLQRVKAARILVSRGAKPTANAHDDPLPAAVSHGNCKLTKLFLAKGGDVNAAPSGEPLLHIAVRNKNLPMARLLLSAGASVDSVSPTGDTALHYAALRGDCEIARLLLSKGARVNERCVIGTISSTPLHAAAFAGEAAVIKLLLSFGAAIDAREFQAPNQEVGNTPLTTAVWEAAYRLGGRSRDSPDMSAKRIEAVQVLLASGAEVNVRAGLPKSAGMTPLQMAMGFGHVALVKTLLCAGAACCEEDALQAESKGYTEVADLVRARIEV